MKESLTESIQHCLAGNAIPIRLHTVASYAKIMAEGLQVLLCREQVQHAMNACDLQ